MVSISASWSVQVGIVEALSNDSALLGLLGGSRIYDHVPQHSDYPFVSVGQAVARDWSTSSEEGHEHFVTLHVWSKHRGRKQVHIIVNALREVLHDGDLQLSDHQLVNLRYDYADVRLDPDGETTHGVVRFRAVTEPVA